MQSKQLENAVDNALEDYKDEISQGLLSEAEIKRRFEISTISEIDDVLENGEFTLEDVQDIVDKMAKEKGIVKKPISLDRREDELANRDDRDKAKDDKMEELAEEEEAKENDENEVDEAQVEEESKTKSSETGISADIIVMLATRFGCSPEQIDFRKIENYQKLQEDTGIKVTSQERGDIWAIRIRRGLLPERYHIINAKTGEMLRPNRGEISTGNIEEAKDYFKYRLRRGENAKPLRRDEERSYITYIDNNGDLKEMKYLNNGRRDDMLREERERYIAEVNEVNIALQEAIEDYQKTATHDNWLKVREIMKERIDIDRKYRIKERGFDNQKNVTIETMKSSVENSTHHCIDDDEEFGPWSSHRRH